MKIFTLLLSAVLALPVAANHLPTSQQLRFGQQPATLRNTLCGKQLNLRNSRPLLGADNAPSGYISQAESFGLLDGEDGTSWFYSFTTTPSQNFDYCYGSADISLYDASNTLVTTVHYDVPEGMRVNAIEPFGAVSSKFFDSNSKTKEFTVYIHEVGPNYNTIGHILVYNSNGELVHNYEAANLLWFDATEKWETYQRAILVTEGQDAEGRVTTVMSVLKPVAWNGTEPTVEHTFELRDELLDYSNGPCLNMYKVGTQPYYVLSYYEQPFTQGWDENYEIILTDNNNYILEVYDKNFQQVTNLKVPVTSPEVAFCSTYAMGLYSYEDLSRGYYSGDDQLNLVITRQDVLLDTDDDTYPYAFLVYNQQGELINTIAENVIAWKQLADIRGEQDQAGFICLNEGVETMRVVQFPECQPVLTLASEINGRRISNNFDRYPVPGGDYQYVIGMGDAEEDDSGNVIAAIGWFTRQGALDHYVKFNLGQSGEYFTPLIEGYSLNPALFNTDSRHEYIYIAKMRRADGSNLIDNVLIIADDEGRELARYCGDDDYALRVASVVDYGTRKPRLVVGLYNQAADIYNVSFYDLPLVKFPLGGTGELDNPYVIASAGDLQQIANEPNANYVLGGSIDLSELADAWKPIPSFTGQLDGKGHIIRNLYLDNNESYAGLFSMLYEGAYLRDIRFDDVTVRLNPGNLNVGAIVGMSTKCTLDSIHICNLQVEAADNAQTLFGGIAGQATYYTVLACNSVTDANIQLPNTSGVGGLVGETRTATSIDACYFSGTIEAQGSVGGIVGIVGKDGPVRNCHVLADISAANTAGGIVGSARRLDISHNYAQGNVSVSSADMYGNVSVGGIIGQIDSDWTKTSTPAIVAQCNLVALESLNAPADSKARHRIVGFTIEDEEYEADEEVRHDKGLANNYALSSITAYGEVGATTPDGADFEAVNTELLTTLGFAMGEEAASPWRLNADGTLSLYFEENVGPGSIETLPADRHSLTPCYNLQGQRQTAGSGFIIRDGKVRFLQ